MRASFGIVSFRILTWCSVVLLAFFSLVPAQKMQEMVPTDLPGEFEHFVAYAGSAAVAMAGYGGMRIIICYWVYAGILEYLQHFSPGRHPAIADFGLSAFGALCGGLAVGLLRRRLHP
jgi:VanZ family protein